MAQTEEELRSARNKAGVNNLDDAKKSYAEQISRLRMEMKLQGITVRDLYEKRTVAALALQLRNQRLEPAPEREERSRPEGNTFIASIVQTSWLLSAFSLAAIWWMGRLRAP